MSQPLIALPNQLPSPVEQSLCAVAALMADAHGPWCIIGSAAVALYANDPLLVQYIDILLTPDDALHLAAKLDVDGQAATPHAQFRSDFFFTWDRSPLPCEFMAGFDLHHDGDWLPVAPLENPDRFDAASHALHVAPPPQLLHLLALFDRDKDAARAKILTQAGFSIGAWPSLR